MKKKSLLFTLFLILVFSTINCKTTANHQIHCDDIELLYNKKLANFGSENQNYIFIRLYYPVYNNPFCVENTLKSSKISDIQMQIEKLANIFTIIYSQNLTPMGFLQISPLMESTIWKTKTILKLVVSWQIWGIMEKIFIIFIYDFMIPHTILKIFVLKFIAYVVVLKYR